MPDASKLSIYYSTSRHGTDHRDLASTLTPGQMLGRLSAEGKLRKGNSVYTAARIDQSCRAVDWPLHEHRLAR